MPTVVYLINVDWFFVSHFQHLARRALSDGNHVILAAQLGPASSTLYPRGLVLVDLPFQRNGIRPKGLAASVRAVEDLLAQTTEPVVHAFGLFGVLVGALATRRLKNVRCVYTITGRGYASVAREPSMRLMRTLAPLFIRYLADDDNTRWMVENNADIAQSGLDRAHRDGRVKVVGGAGVDPDVFVSSALPARPPLRIGFVARLIWSKGLDIAVRAVAMARARGCDVTLTVAGQTDDSNPRAFTKAELAKFAAAPGVQFVGKVQDIPEFWRHHHVAFLPSRGGEGLPKSLLEAASCARPILTSRVPGCEELANATNGWVIPVEDAAAAADTIIEIAASQDLEARGAFARSVIKKDYSETKLWETAEEFYFK
ncbi:glycosyltransferase [Hyphomicrobium sp.]|uniref:glycosyltransferase n=1 Tax=Hyphomicrobium sp. TaxID=82 RepID=UPI0025C2BB3D|nr:glycosyltransferase [Hyphomicrobium sp.]MCC7251908.1 glycosyltransferase [Hyphomicrobium sp.]